MHSFLISAVVVCILTILALVVVSALRRRRLQQRVRLEITNGGNIQSCYALRAEDPEGALKFQFSLDGRSLPRQAALEAEEASRRKATGQAGSRRAGTGPTQDPSQQPAQGGGPAGGIVQAADGALGAGAGLAGFLGTLGLLLPRSIGGPLLSLSARMRTQQVAVARVRYAPAQAARVKRFVPWRLRRMGSTGRSRQAGRASQARQDDATPWVQTPSVLPGETLSVSLRIRAAGSARSRHASGGAKQGGKSQGRLYRVISRSVEQEEGAAVVAEGTVQVLGGFWAHPFLPYVLIVASAVALLALAYWLTSGGVLACGVPLPLACLPGQARWW
jgi:hypothetical protein